MRQRPGRERVRAEALVDERQRRLEHRIAQVGEHRRDLAGRQHALVGEDPRRQADDEEQRSLGEPQRVGLRLDALARDVELSLEIERIARRGPGAKCGRHADEDLLEDRLRRASPCAQPASSVGTCRQPSTCRPSSSHDAREERLHLIPFGLVLRQENQTGAVLALPWQLESKPLRAKERVRHLQQDAGAVTGVGLAAAGAAMLEIDQQLQPLLDDGVRAASFEVDDEADAARIALEAGVVKTLRLGQLGVLMHRGILAGGSLPQR